MKLSNLAENYSPLFCIMELQQRQAIEVLLVKV